MLYNVLFYYHLNNICDLYCFQFCVWSCTLCYLSCSLFSSLWFKVRFLSFYSFNRLGSAVYSFVYFARAMGANIGIIASSFILPKFGWLGCFIFFGILTVISFILLLVFNEKPLPANALKEKKSNNGTSSPNGSFGVSTIAGGF